MSDYERGWLYLYERDGATGIGAYDERGGVFNEADRVAWLYEVTNVRPAIVLDPQDEDVQMAIKARRQWSSGWVRRLFDKIAAQITPPKPPMEEPTEWGAKVTDDRGDWLRVEDSESPWLMRDATDMWSDWSDMVNPRPLDAEGVRDE